jgi:hypothetical protein
MKELSPMRLIPPQPATVKMVTMSESDLRILLQEVASGLIKQTVAMTIEEIKKHRGRDYIRLAEVQRRMGSEKPRNGVVKMRPMSYHKCLVLLESLGVNEVEAGLYDWDEIETKLNNHKLNNQNHATETATEV